MRPLINKNKLFLYLFFLIFLSSIFNFKFLENFNKKFSLKKINIIGLSNKEKKIVEIELNDLKNLNIFKLSEKNIFQKLKKFNFLEDIYVNKIIPSSLDINLSKTSILGQTLRNGEKFYIGKNKKYINPNQVTEIKEIALVFGDFKIEEYLNLINILKENQLDIKNIEKFYYYKNKRWDLIFYNDQKLMLPSNNVEEAIKIYKKLSNNNDFINKEIIDLRVKNQIIVTNRNE